jgi:hypothetical protein
MYQSGRKSVRNFPSKGREAERKLKGRREGNKTGHYKPIGKQYFFSSCLQQLLWLPLRQKHKFNDNITSYDNSSDD